MRLVAAEHDETIAEHALAAEMNVEGIDTSSDEHRQQEE